MAAPSTFKMCSGTTRSIFPVNPNRCQSASNQSNPSLLFFPKKTLQERFWCRVSPSLMISNSPLALAAAEAVERQERDGGRADDANTEKRLDKWMKVSVQEIVDNIKKAPLLVQVYADGKEIRTEHAVEDEWEGIKMEWEKGQRRLPDGIIFVEDLSDGLLEKVAERDEDGETKVWGIVVQGRGGGSGGDGSSSPLCYLLKTTRVPAGAGLGLFCTYFSLIRVTSFTETALSQFNNSWSSPTAACAAQLVTGLKFGSI